MARVPTAVSRTWIDRTVGLMSPRWELQRIRARIATDLVLRNYEGAAAGRRTQGWTRSSTDASSATGPFVARLRDTARDLVRNNPWAESALTTIADHAVGWGIVATAKTDPRVLAAWDAWANSTACDAEGRNDFAGIQKLIMRTAAEAGEVLVRRRFRLPQDGLPIPLQLQILEPDYLDTTKHGITLPNGGRIVYGVEFDAIGRRAAYWLFGEHPGNSGWWAAGTSQRIPAENILHVFKSTRPGQVRAASWFAPVLVRFKDTDVYEDATLMKQKIAACLAVIMTDIDGGAGPLGVADDTSNPGVDSLEPGAILNVPPGRDIKIVDPPSVREYADYIATSHRAIAAGLGVTYEDMTGDYTDLPFSAARMSRLRHWARVEDWRWRMLIPQFCDPVWRWAMEAAMVMGLTTEIPRAEWTAPPAPMIDPAAEGLAYQRNIRTGIQTLSDVHRERGYNSPKVLAEMQADNAALDRLGLVLDSDPRRMTQAGQAQTVASPAAPIRSFERALDRVAALMRSLPDQEATKVFAALFGGDHE